MVVDTSNSTLLLGGCSVAFVVGALRPRIAIKSGIYALVTATGIRGRNEYQLWVHYEKMKHDQMYYAQWQGMDELNRHDKIFGEVDGFECKLKHLGALSIAMAGGCALGGGCGWACRCAAQRIPTDVMRHMFP